MVALLLIWRAGRALERDARHSAVINRFTESTAFASDDRAVASSNLEALALLVRPDAGVVHILNRSQDRAIPEASVGDPIAEVLPLKTLGECPGMFRGSTHVNGDVSAALSARCPVYPASAGTVACVPLISGESVGAVHLHWARPHSLPHTTLPDVNRLAQHAALAIANRRLLAALQGQASTDARTGLPNSRAFDVALEAALADLPHGSSVSVLMLDLDRFKDFNDRHGHPAGDEALRVFAGVLAASVRDNDLAARYGGEEFTVLLPGLALADALVVAERIRQRAESTLIPLAPGITDRVTVSVGVASAPEQGTDRVSLLRAADEALYRAKDAGRNRVAHPHDATPSMALPAAVA
jgi:diguanylate cyclase (GGDEF)-like protein